MTKMTENQMKVRLHKIIAENSEFTTWTISTPHIMLLVKQAIEEEREACAKVCYELPWKDMCHIPSNLAFAAAIRARSNNDD
jgi:hypothetical protein